MQIQVIAYPGETGVKAVLTARPGATGTPAADYTLTGVGSLYSGTIAEALTGEWLVEVKNGNNEPLFSGYWTADSDPRCYDYTVGVDPTVLNQIKAKTDLIGTGTAFISAPVSDTGDILVPIVIGDDYLLANGRAFVWTVPKVAGIATVGSTAWFGARSQQDSSSFFLVQGTVADFDANNWTLTFDIPQTATSACKQGQYDWSVAVHNSGKEITKVRATNKFLQMVRKYT